MGRKLGQHFLKDRRALKKIVAALEINPRDTIIEIGPGHGELTRHLLAADPGKIIAIEKDKKLVELLDQKFKNQGSKVKIVEGDILKLLPTLYFPPKADSPRAKKFKVRNWKLTGNIPYYITGYLFRKISELKQKPKLIVFTIQKEVAERICAQPPKMNLLAASIQFWGKPQIIGYISKKSFRPPPKVDSAVIKITPYHLSRHGGISDMKYYEFIRILFKQPRKTVLNNLRGGFKLPQKELEKRLQKLGISPKLRPADLSLSDINNLSANFPQ